MVLNVSNIIYSFYIQFYLPFDSRMYTQEAASQAGEEEEM